MEILAGLFIPMNVALGAVAGVWARRRFRLAGASTFSGPAKAVIVAGAGAYGWLICAILESSVFVFAPYPAALLPVFVAISSGCLLLGALAVWMIFRARPQWARYVYVTAVAIVIGMTNLIDTLRRTAISTLELWLLFGGISIVLIEVGTFALIEWRSRRNQAKSAAAAKRSPD